MAPGADPDGPPPERDPYGDRRPPYSEDAEQAVLGAMMIDTDAVMRASEIVDDTMFYREAHRRLFRAMLALTERRDVVDPLTLADELTRRGELEAAGRTRLHHVPHRRRPDGGERRVPRPHRP